MNPSMIAHFIEIHVMDNVKLSSYYSQHYRRSFVHLVAYNIRPIADWRIAHEINICIL